MVEVVASPPTIPDKWDIIPIHGSDIASFKRCRRYWDWTSPARSNLRRRVDIYGINMPLWFGTGIHYALEMYYDPILQRDPVESFKTWYQYQWDGGIGTEHWLDRTYDLNPRKLGAHEYAGSEWEDYGEPLWEIRGLREILPNLHEVQEEFEQHLELGIGMMEFYREWAPANDNFVCVAAESSYSIPLGFDAKDTREDSPNFGQTLQVHARGKRDAVIYFPDTGKFGIIDHKTAARIDEDYFLKLDKDEQCSNYLWATIRESELNPDLPWYGQLVDRVLYTALRKNYPKPPSITQHGWPSLDRQKEGTTAELFKEAIVGNDNLETWFRENEKAQLYYTYLCEIGDSAFIQRDLVVRNKYEIEATGTHLAMVAKEMLNNPMIYPNPTGEFRCLQCAFRSPCIAADDGSDAIGMLLDGYETNKER